MEIDSMLNLFRQLPQVVQLGLAGSTITLVAFLVWAGLFLAFRQDPAASAETAAPRSDQAAQSSSQQIAGPVIGAGMTVVNAGVLNLTVQNFGDVPIARYRVTEASSAVAEVEFVLLYTNAIWAFGSDSVFLNSSGSQTDLQRFLSSADFRQRATQYSDIICLGLASNASEPPIMQNVQLSADRAVRLCRSVQVHLNNDRVRVSAVGLGYSTVSAAKNSAEERRQRGVVLVGVRQLQGHADIESVVTQLLRAGEVNGFDFRQYEALRGQDSPSFETVSRRTVGE